MGQLDRDDTEFTGPENYFVCSPAEMQTGDFEVLVNNYSGETGTVMTVLIRAGSQVRSFNVTVDEENFGENLIPVTTVTYNADGTFTFSN